MYALIDTIYEWLKAVIGQWNLDLNTYWTILQIVNMAIDMRNTSSQILKLRTQMRMCALESNTFFHVRRFIFSCEWLLVFWSVYDAQHTLFDYVYVANKNARMIFSLLFRILGKYNTERRKIWHEHTPSMPNDIHIRVYIFFLRMIVFMFSAFSRFWNALADARIINNICGSCWERG